MTETSDRSGRATRPRLGKRPARENSVTFKLERYLVTPRLPTPPLIFGDQDIVGPDWGVLGNNDYGDCVWAGAAHETMLWNKEAGQSIAFTDGVVLSDYSAVTGFDPAHVEETDKGTDMQEAASYRQRTGVLDESGQRHKVLAYVALRAGDFDQLMLATYLFGAAGVGFVFPQSAWDQFDNNAPWDVVPGSPAKDGHYVPSVGRDADGNLIVVTWGRLQRMTPAFYTKYNDETVAYVTDEFLQNDKSRLGFNRQQLLDDLGAIGR